MKALILAAGYATRLYPLTKEYPKPLLHVGGRPLIDYIIDKLVSLKEIDEIIVVTNSKFILKFKNWKKTIKISKRLSLVDDLTKNHDDKRGAIGDMHFCIEKKRIKDDLLVLGGDNLFDGKIEGLIKFARSKRHQPVIGAYDIKDKKQAHHYGVLKVDARGRIVDFEEKPKKPKSTLVAMCVYYFPKGKLGFISEYLLSKDKHDALGFYIDWLRKRDAIYAYKFGGRWYDIGDSKFYHKAKEYFQMKA
jgi:glucose-1-phosphate thymidylyltransferase